MSQGGVMIWWGGEWVHAVSCCIGFRGLGAFWVQVGGEIGQGENLGE